ncbi:MAG: calcium/sodium antiporter [Muribaculum sp.]|nr:calcium/sodium antiporter [Muribaculaceae bacterium]MCM1080238.1 calcium/sodium antiporter [Muribaculum sp.]
MLDIILLIGGLVLILAGANFLTDGASSMAKRWGVSELVIGLTIVAFGTSAPELAISVLSAIQGNAGLAVGNVVGSNIFNILVIVGVSAIILPLKIGKGIMLNEVPMVVLSCLVILVCANSPLLDGSQQSVLSRSDGLIMLLFFAIFMRYTFSIAKNEAETTDPKAQPVKQLPLWRAISYILGGLAALIWGGDIFVDRASGLAKSIGVSDAMIGLTIVAAGTSVPDLAASAMAAVKHRPEMAVGNAIGSCLFNIFLVLGASATIHPLPMGTIGNFDLLSLLGASLLFWLFGWIIGHSTITRAEGIIMVLAYIAYLTAVIIRA